MDSISCIHNLFRQFVPGHGAFDCLSLPSLLCELCGFA
jgi:hypothetical protein